MNILIWHVHGSWTTSLVHGPHTYLIPRLPDRGPDGAGRPSRAGTFHWPEHAVEVSPHQCREREVDIVVLQRPHEEGLLPTWLGPRDVPKIYVEHNAPQGRIGELRHPMADRADLLLVHVTHFNDLFWDAGTTRTTVVEHGIPDPGERYSGDVEAAAVVINSPVRRGRVTGTDLLPRFARAGRVDLFGMESEPLGGLDLPQTELHTAMARRRLYLHPLRWTSLGLSLVEAMHLGMPIVGLATTEAVQAVPGRGGVLSTDVEVLCTVMRELLADPDRARQMGRAARAAALERYALSRFLADWERIFAEETAG